jgi:hypothetical protein
MIPDGGAFWMDLEEASLQSSGAAVGHYATHAGALADFAVVVPDGSTVQWTFATLGTKTYRFNT